jgi:DNA-binding response OmpR family regulator
LSGDKPLTKQNLTILAAEDDIVSRRILEKNLEKWGYEVITVDNGAAALAELEKQDSIRIALLDWMMPEVDGLEVCRRVRNNLNSHYIYIIMLTAKDRKEDIAAGLEAGADDYIVKPYQQVELRSRLLSARRILELEHRLAEKIDDLEEALSQVKMLKGFLPICSHCKNVRDDEGYWQSVEIFVHEHSDAVFSHSVCPDCLERHYPE